jgi:hypothetical protein
LAGCPDNEVERERPFEGLANSNRLIGDVGRRHDHKQINVALAVRPAVRIRAEKDNSLGMELVGDLPGKAPDGGQRHVRRRVAISLDGA